MRIIVVTGISGSGKSVALNVLEDSGYFCIDNLPAELLDAAARNAFERGVQRLAVAIDIRSFSDSQAQQIQAEIDFKQALSDLKNWQSDVRLLFLSANDATLIARFSETRRRHPLSRMAGDQPERSLEGCIAHERLSMSGIAAQGHVIDTSGLSVAALRQGVRDFSQAVGTGIILTFESFGFKHSVPQDADLVFDARCLPNPHYEPLLKPLTGLDPPVQTYLSAIPEVTDFVDDVTQFLRTWLPRYVLDGRQYLTVAIGCTGGQHRSVYVVEQLAARFKPQARVLVRHRQQAAKLAAA